MSKDSTSVTSSRTAASSSTDSFTWRTACLCLLHASIFLWAALVLPWRTWTLFSGAAILLALIHTLCAIAIFFAPQRVAQLLRLQGYLALALSAIAVLAVFVSARFVSELYDGLGQPIGAALVILLIALLFWTLPMGIWSIHAARPKPRETARRRPLLAGLIAAGFIIMWAVACVVVPRIARGKDLPATRELALSQLAWTRDALRTITTRSPTDSQSSATRTHLAPRQAPAFLFQPHPVHCPHAKQPNTLAAVVTAHPKGGQGAQLKCIQGTGARFKANLRRHLRHLRADKAIVVDIITHEQDLERLPRLFQGLAVRPGIDGICSPERACFMPWQLVGLELLGTLAPIRQIPDLKFGISLKRVRQQFGKHVAAAEEPMRLTRITVDSLLRMPSGEVKRFKRYRAHSVSKTHGSKTGISERSRFDDRVSRARTTARRYIHRAQLADGRFRYAANAYTGFQNVRHMNVPRQAGTTMALCRVLRDETPSPTNLSSSPEGASLLAARTSRQIIVQAIRALNAMRLDTPSFSAMRDPGSETLLRIGPSALTLAALLRCRPLLGVIHDRSIVNLGRFLLRLARTDGSFQPAYDLRESAPKSKPSSWFGPGQAMLALLLLEEALPDIQRSFLHRERPGVGSPSLRSFAHTLTGQLERSMDYYGKRYWSHPLASFFFLEENWHCLAARVALRAHRHRAYENFCLDYTRFRNRFHFENQGDVAASFVGGFGVTSVMTPQSTAAAAHGETLAAAIPILRAHQKDSQIWEGHLRRTINFLLRHQYDASSCVFCRSPFHTLGGFSESVASPTIRIDFVQHALAAIHQGSRVLNREGNQPRERSRQ